MAIVGVFVVLGLAATIESAIVSAQLLGDAAAYDRAPVCASIADGSACRFQGPARIVRTYMDKQYPAVEVAFDQLGGVKATALLDPNGPLQWQRWRPEDRVNAELWRGHLTLIDGVWTGSNPDMHQGGGLTAAGWIAGSFSVLLAAGFLWMWVEWRRGRRTSMMRLAAETAGHTESTTQLPLTQDMVEFLKKDSSAADRPLETALVILGMAAVAPAFFTILFVLSGVALSQSWSFLAFFWAFFLGLGGLLSVAIIRDARREKRDLTGSAFNRFTGPFSIRTTTSKTGTYVQVVVDRRTLSKERAPTLENLEAGAGVVDYLPVSGELMAVRDESGAVLWERFEEPSQSRQVDPIKV